MKYTVMPGDTMYMIAARYGITLNELVQANPQISNPDLIYPGQVIEIPIPEPPQDQLPEPEIPLPEFPEFPCGGIEPEFPGGGMLPEFPGGGMLPEFPGGGMLPEFPGGGMLSEFPGGGMFPEFPSDMLTGTMGAGVPEQLVGKGDRGKHVAALQRRLKELGYFNGQVTGRFGSKTKAAVKKLQHDCNMKQTGVVDRAVWRSIGR